MEKIVRYVNEVLVIHQESEDLVEDTRGQRTLKNIRKQNLNSAIYNFAVSWKDVMIMTLSNPWKNLLFNEDFELDFEGFEPQDFNHTVKK